MLVASVLLATVATRQLFFSPSVSRSAATPPAIPSEPITLDAAASRGAETAPVVVIEFSDFQCLFCARFNHDVLPAVESSYISTQKVQLFYRYFPLTDVHPQAWSAAKLAECARQQGAFWPAHDALFAIQRDLDAISIAQVGAQLGLASAKLELCERTVDSAISRDVALGRHLGVRATPSVFVGLREKDNRVRLKSEFTGVPSKDALEASIEGLLSASR